MWTARKGAFRTVTVHAKTYKQTIGGSETLYGQRYKQSCISHTDLILQQTARGGLRDWQA